MCAGFAACCYDQQRASGDLSFDGVSVGWIEGVAELVTTGQRMICPMFCFNQSPER
jgi:hypothetical protein